MAALWKLYNYTIILTWIMSCTAGEKVNCPNVFRDCDCQNYTNTLEIYCPQKLFYRLSLRLPYNANKKISTKELYLECLTDNETDFLDVKIAEIIEFDEVHILNIKNCSITKDTIIFSNLTNITLLDISNNNLKDIPPNIFTSLKNVKSINLTKSHLEILPSYLFQDNLLLEEIILNENFNITLPDKLFENLFNLVNASMEHCHITYLPENLFRDCKKLRYLNLRGNALTKLPKSFMHLTHLVELDLSSNMFSFADNASISFNNCEYLRKVNISFNNLVDNIFHKCVYLEELDLSYNNLTDFPHLITMSFIQIKKLNLGNNYIKYIETDSFKFVSKYNVDINLKNNNISIIDMTEVDDSDFISKSNVHLDNNYINCSNCKTLNLIEYLKKRKISNFLHLRPDNLRCMNSTFIHSPLVVSLDVQNFTCLYAKDQCPKECACKLHPYKRTLIINCAYRNLTIVPNLCNMAHFNFEKEVHLEGNHLTAGPTKDMCYDNVTSLYLFKNNLDILNWIPDNIQVLDLHGNKFTNFSYGIIDKLNKNKLLTHLSIHDNLWRCNCFIANLSNFLRHNNEKVLDIGNILCNDKSTSLIDLNETNLCNIKALTVLLIIMVVVLLIFILAVLFFLYYRYNTLIKAYFFKHGIFLDCIIIKEDFGDKNYDAFITYSKNDEEFVLDQIVSVLESTPNCFKLCLPFREGLAGEINVDEIPRLMRDSKRNIVILSNKFLENVWNCYELRTAHLNVMTDSNNKVIVIILGDVDLDNLDQELEAYLKINTYLKWGDPWFWMKLNYAMPNTKITKINSTKK